MNQIKSIQAAIRKVSSAERAKSNAWFFKTGEGQYGYGDKFLGITVPELRKIATKFKDQNLDEIKTLLESAYHEERLIALFILVAQFKRGSGSKKKEIFNFYLKNTKHVNNWDLVDSSAHYIVGEYLRTQKDKSLLSRLAHSENLWERRIAMIATFQFIRQDKNAKYTFEIAEILLHDRHDLIQKAVGWMLREVGKHIGREVEEEFLKKHYKEMGRTALRYSIEHFEPEKSLKYLKGEI